MKIAVVLLLLVPVAMSTEINKRSFLSHLGFPHLVDLEFIKAKTQEILDKIGSDESLQRCQDTCHNVLSGDESGLIHTLCNPLCRSFQTVVHLFNLHPNPTDATPVEIGKRSFLSHLGFPHLVDLEFIKAKTQEILDKIGSDESLQRCQDTCHNVLSGDESGLIHTLCNPLCRSFQTVVHLFNLHPNPTDATPVEIGKRSFLSHLGFPHLVDLEFIKAKTQEILDKIGSDESLQRCQDTCHNVLSGDESGLIHTLCNPLCRSFQTLVNLFHLHPTPTTSAPVEVVTTPTPVALNKRFLNHLGFPNLVDLDFIKAKTQEILDKIGSDESLQRCEDTCHNVLSGDESGLIHTLCHPLCRSFQTLVNLFHLHPTPTTSAPVEVVTTPTPVALNKRFLNHLGFPNLVDLDFIKAKTQEILDKIGSDESLQRCEDTCHNVLSGDESGLIHTLCHPLCRSFQTLVHLFHLHPTPTTSAPVESDTTAPVV
ncbi:uncharacterized protein LOC143282633 isoform X2 [Babylonia areolata]|uniref:uncharacterized protein LOC143282633 isoform X2 n=1 Tax=Babylonia areolata TaxID=304850 RepID=UPI003FD6829F